MSKTTAEKLQAIATRLVSEGNGAEGSPRNAWIADVVLAATLELGLTMAQAQDALVAGFRAGALNLVRVDLSPAFDRDDMIASELVVASAPHGDDIRHFVRG